MGKRRETEAIPARGVSIRTTQAGTEILQLAFSYKGKRYRKSLNVSPTRNNILAANRRLEQIKLDIQMGVFDLEKYFDTPDPLAQAKSATIGDLVWERMERKRRIEGANGWDASTYGERLKLYRNHIAPNFGHLTVPELTARHIKDWLTRQTFSLSYGQIIMSLLNPIVAEALADGVIDRHPYQHIKLADYLTQRTTRQRKERIDPLDEQEVHALLGSIRKPQERNYLQFMLFSGLRLQEGPLVRWEDIDWNHRTLLVSRAIGHANDKEYVKSTKTGEERTVELTPPAWDALMSQRQFTQLQGELIFVPPYHRRDMAYEWMSRTYIRSLWARALKQAGIRSANRSPKQTRHTFCSLMIAAGKPLTWVAQQAGHSSLAMLEQHYAKAVRLAANRHQEYSFEGALQEAIERDETAKKLQS
ncbi:phage integrase [Marinobacterium nitratireducens]|uniref:Phage integrase n=1 Tax=Marinobacterium nitratireducens TaxID=518897 RepID=A0A917ZR28_9GAMM|nr:site-specific integrase [Marinobacterium nitratireducens]GGO89223.1 phage integrase [Marinobacterium nitratireducens]